LQCVASIEKSSSQVEVRMRRLSRISSLQKWSDSWGLETHLLEECVAAFCSVLQRVAACCSVLQRVAACCSVL